jgi:hypothetical protein
MAVALAPPGRGIPLPGHRFTQVLPFGWSYGLRAPYGRPGRGIPVPGHRLTQVSPVRMHRWIEGAVRNAAPLPIRRCRGEAWCGGPDVDPDLSNPDDPLTILTDTDHASPRPRDTASPVPMATALITRSMRRRVGCGEWGAARAPPGRGIPVPVYPCTQVSPVRIDRWIDGAVRNAGAWHSRAGVSIHAGFPPFGWSYGLTAPYGMPGRGIPVPGYPFTQVFPRSDGPMD